MAIVQAPPRTSSVPTSPARDGGIDLVRALCVVAVVVLHALMVGVTVDTSGPVFANAAEGAAWFAPITWVLQVMPLFFVIGGFSGLLALRSMHARGGTSVGFVVGRLHRLLRPAVLVIAVVGVALAALAAMGVPADLLQIAGFRYTQPLWFLGVFLLCQALLPAMVAAHRRAPVRSILTLVAAAVLVDVARAASGIEVVGFLNLGLVWLTLQQLGFFFADGRIDALPRRIRALGAMIALVGLIAALVTGVFSPDLIENLNPPTTALLLVGAVQTAVLSLLRDRLSQFSRRRPVRAFTAFLTPRTMTIYLWHMPVLLTLAGASALLAMTGALSLPDPSSLAWWLGRPLWLCLALLATALVAAALAGFERRAAPALAPTSTRTVVAVMLGLSAVVLLLAASTSPLTAMVAVAVMFGSFRLVGDSGRTGRRTSVWGSPRRGQSSSSSRGSMTTSSRRRRTPMPVRELAPAALVEPTGPRFPDRA